MKRSHLLFALLAFSLILISGFIYIVKNPHKSPFNLISPLPKIFSQNRTVLASGDFWTPDIEQPLIKESSIAISSKAVIVYDLHNDVFIYGKQVNKRLPFASITKIMTAIVALESEDLDKKYTVSARAAEIGENAMLLEEGEQLSLRDLLYGLILPSGNDAAEVIAEGSKYGRDGFIYMMNKKAEDLGLSDTHFTNPSGLQGDGNQYTTVRDLLVITRYGLQNKTFADIVSTYEHEISATDTNKAYYLYNDTNLLTTYPGVKGVKTGFTDEAGMCLVTYLEYKDHKIIAVVLNSENRRQEMKDLLDISLKALGTEPPTHH